MVKVAGVEGCIEGEELESLQGTEDAVSIAEVVDNVFDIKKAPQVFLEVILYRIPLEPVFSKTFCCFR